VIEIDGARAGRQRVVRAPDHLELAGIQLLPAHQGHGLGTYLIEQFLLDARRAGLPARITVDNDNPRARALYERLGFVAVAGSDDETTLQWPAP
jgi:ribosomal protein S18 acetylase RimI-like enzyme